jgi:branched-subunit amino acid aminotransferase/4-amino-4-deoxychorismate lyase
VGGGYGHFTAMQVRDRKVRGMDLHLARLDEGSRALFAGGLDGDQVRRLIRHALGEDTRDGSARVFAFGTGPGIEPSLVVMVREPALMPTTPRILKSVDHQLGRLVERSGFDEALLVTPGGLIAEGSITTSDSSNETRSCGLTRRHCMGSPCRYSSGSSARPGSRGSDRP